MLLDCRPDWFFGTAAAEPGRLEGGIIIDLAGPLIRLLTMEEVHEALNRTPGHARAAAARGAGRGLGALALLALLLLAAACRSPNRGVWQGTFDGTVRGTVEFRINARGTRLSGSMSGSTRNHQPFRAELDGKIQGDHFYATFEGASRAGALPVAFTGFLRGTLAGGRGAGDWQCELAVTRQKLEGEWAVEQVAVE